MPFSLTWGDNLVAKVIAINVKGESEESDPTSVGGIILTQPDAPASVADVPSVTSKDTVGLTWLEGAQNGGSPVIDYRVSYNQGYGTVFYTLESNIVDLPYSANPLVVGTEYKFKV